MASTAQRPTGLVARLLLVVLAAAVVTPLGAVISRPVVHDWADTVGFTAGVIAACIAIRGVLGRLGGTASQGS